jgi:chaperonin GroES
MLNLETKLDLAKVVREDNVAELLSKQDCQTIACHVYDSWSIDQSSRMAWEQQMANALKLATQVSEQKTFPWPNCSNVKFPMITIAALQFHARAYQALLPGPDVVKCKVYGADPEGIEAMRAARIADHMSYQVLEEDEAWEEVHDRILITVPIIGCAFKKIYFDSDLGRVVSSFVPAKNLYIPYFAASLETASRLTEYIELSPNKLIQRVRSDLYLKDVAETRPAADSSNDLLETVQDQIQGQTEPAQDLDRPYELLEQHGWLDLDGDGYQEPYIITIRKDTKQLCRIVARFVSPGIHRNSRKEVMSIEPTHYYEKYSFIPSPDGGIYDLGWGCLLGPLNESINTAINQLLDAGTLATTGGGFLGRGARLRSGNIALKPFEWVRVDATGDDLRKSIVPASFKEPSMVLFQLLQLLISYGERVAGVTDSQVGVNPGQNTPAETTRTVVAEGQKVFLGILKRLYRSMKKEFQKRYILNRHFLDSEFEYYSPLSGMVRKVLAQDYIASEKVICPVADPNMLTDAQRLQQVQLLKQSAATTQGYDLAAVERRFLEALRIPDISQVFPGPDKVPAQPHYRIQIETMRSEAKAAENRANLQLEALKLLGEADINQAKIGKLQAETLAISQQAQNAHTNQQLAIINAQIGAARAKQDTLLKAAAILQRSIQLEKGSNDSKSENNGAGMGGVETSPGDDAVSQVLGTVSGEPEATMGLG